MALELVSGPAVEPLSLAEVKAHIKVDHDDEDMLIASLITASRIHVEVVLARALVTQSWSLFLDDWPEGAELALPVVPLQSVSSVKVYDGEDVATVIAADNYFVDAV